MKPILPLLLALLSSSIAQADNPNVCTILEGSDLTRNIDLDLGSEPTPDLSKVITFSSNIAFSRDRQRIALYQVSDSKKLATFTLFESNTGKLLQRQTLDNYEERSHQTALQFSPKEGIVYLRGMSYPEEGGNTSGAIPFWNLASNELVFSPCTTGMGVSTVQFSDDETVAFSTTVDSFNSLCSTQEAKVLETKDQGGEYTFDPKTKRLQVGKADEDESSFDIDDYSLDGYKFSSKIFRLGGKDYRVVGPKWQSEAGGEQNSVQLYDVESQQVRPLQTADLFLHHELVEPAGGAPEYQTVSYNEETKQVSVCRLPLIISLFVQ